MIRLRRDGQRPLRFTGHLIADWNGSAPDAGMRHALAMYAETSGGYAVAIAAYQDGRPARCHAWLCDALEPALRRLEDHDATRDICPGLNAPACDSGDPANSALALAVQAAELRAWCLDVERRYRTAVGAFLAHLAQTSAFVTP